MSALLARRVVHLLPLDVPPHELPLVAWLGGALNERVGVLSVQDAPLPIEPAWLDATSGQCSSNSIVDALIHRAEGRQQEEWTLAITGADLFADGRDYVFGEAAVGGAWAVVSLARLRATGDDPDRLRSRLLIEALHELGHVAGLAHCPRPRCAMSRATLAEDVDRKEPDFCPDCRAALEANT